MANVSFANLSSTFNFNDNDYIEPQAATGYSAVPTLWGWFNDQNAGFVSTTWVSGVGFTYLGNSITGGTITEASVNTDGNPGHNIAADAFITGLSVDASLLNLLIDGGLTADQQNNLYWRTVLSGDDVINLGTSAFSITFAGDGADVEAGQYIAGGADTITGESNGSPISGDFFDIAAGATLIGGGDIIIKSDGGIVHGDASNVFGTLIGGSDFIVGSGALHGDAQNINIGGVVIGGNDTLIRQGAGNAFGDVFSIHMNEGLVGGADTLVGSSGGDGLAGDTTFIASDALYFIGGDDILVGGAGNDSMYGDWVTNGLGASAIGGNDVLIGGAGNDLIEGNGGNDYLEGNQGMDNLFGGDGSDTAAYTSAISSIYVDLFNNQALADGYGTTDTLMDIENATGSFFDDTIVGDQGDNVLQGLFGADGMYGLGGNDYMLGGVGADMLFGGEGYDSFAFRAGEINAGQYDRIMDFSESATSFDSLRFEGISQADLQMADFGGDVYITTNALAYSGGIVIENFTVAQLADQMLFV